MKTTFTDEEFETALSAIKSDKVNPKCDISTCVYAATNTDYPQRSNAASHCVAGMFFHNQGVTDDELKEVEGMLALDAVGALGYRLSEAQIATLTYIQTEADNGSTHSQAIEMHIPTDSPIEEQG